MHSSAAAARSSITAPAGAPSPAPARARLCAASTMARISAGGSALAPRGAKIPGRASASRALAVGKSLPRAAGRGMSVRVMAGEDKAANTAALEALLPKEEAYAGATVIMEVDSIVFDLNNMGHRMAFNAVFAELGLDCANWEPMVYGDLLRMGGGTPQGMVSKYFDMVGWPTFLPTDERDLFVNNVVKKKKKAFVKMAADGEIPLMNDFLPFLDALLAEGIRVVFIGGTGSQPGDGVLFSALDKIGSESFEEEVSNRMAEEKSRIADMMQKGGGAGGIGEGLFIDAGLSGAEVGGMTRAWLETLASAELETTVGQCIYMGGSMSSCQAAASAGMMPVAVKGPLTRGAEFPEGIVTFDGMGPGGGVTWPRMKLVWEKTQAEQS